MIIKLETPLGQKKANLSEPISIALSLKHGNSNPNCYWAEDPVFDTIIQGDFVGDVKRGGSVNYKKVSFTPHGNGTHTECYGHISEEDVFVNKCMLKFNFLAELISVDITPHGTGHVARYDEFKKQLKYDFVSAVIIRTLPNDNSKKIRRYSGTNPPYFDPEILSYLAEQNIDHLITDLPSVDPEQDSGKLEGHKHFWNIPRRVRRESTITELAFIPNEVENGLYFLQLQIPNLELDAVPSFPIIYKIY